MLRSGQQGLTGHNGMQIPVLVSDLDLECQLWLKIRLAPMTPYFGTISLAFVGPPTIKVQLLPYNRVRLMRVPVVQVCPPACQFIVIVRLLRSIGEQWLSFQDKKHVFDPCNLWTVKKELAAMRYEQFLSLHAAVHQPGLHNRRLHDANTPVVLFCHICLYACMLYTVHQAIHDQMYTST